jgi:hypothetical protein
MLCNFKITLMYCYTVIFIKILTENTIIFEIKAVKLVFPIENLNLYFSHRFTGRSRAYRDFLRLIIFVKLNIKAIKNKFLMKFRKS